MKKTCRISGKVKYDTSERALRRGGYSANNPSPSMRGIASYSDYKCKHCGKFHLTSHDKPSWIPKSVSKKLKCKTRKLGLLEEILARHPNKGIMIQEGTGTILDLTELHLDKESKI